MGMNELMESLIDGLETQLEKDIGACMLKGCNVAMTAQIVDRAMITVERYMRDIEVIWQGQLTRLLKSNRE